MYVLSHVPQGTSEVLANIECPTDAQPGTLFIDYFPILERLPKSLQPGRKFITTIGERSTAVHKPFLKEMEKQVQAGTAPSCFAADLVQMESGDSQIDEDAAVNILAMLVDAGADTTSAAIQSFFKVMALHPLAMKAAQEGMLPCQLFSGNLTDQCCGQSWTG